MSLRQSLRSGVPLSEAVTELNRQLCAQQSSLSVTLFVGRLNLKTLRLSYVNAGHSPALVAGKNGEPYALTACSGPAAGVFEKSEYSEYAAELKAGDSLWLYTEGVSGAQNAKGELYGPERLKTLLSEGSSGDTLRALLSDVAAFRGGAEPADDLTVLTLRLL
ncbi:MAG TPA: serine/threonine-protein phosphatase [Candidatus Avisuccinivibrio pullicola]|nr:serine/threonine-protein phosphatase [Candidatus Avisuccinivibrio pullicola]